MIVIVLFIGMMENILLLHNVVLVTRTNKQSLLRTLLRLRNQRIFFLYFYKYLRCAQEPRDYRCKTVWEMANNQEEMHLPTSQFSCVSPYSTRSTNLLYRNECLSKSASFLNPSLIITRSDRIFSLTQPVSILTV